MPTPTTLPRRAAAPLAAVALLAGCGTSDAPAPSDAAPPASTTRPSIDPASVDWKPLAYEALGCHSREAWVADGLPPHTWDEASYEVVGGKVLGDGDTDAVVTIACPQGMGSSGAAVVVFGRVADDAEPVGELHGEMVFQAPTTTVEDGTVVLEGPTVAGDDAICCAGHWGRAEYRWADGAFALVHHEEAFTSRPISHAGLPDGSYTTVLRAVDDREVLVDLVEWLEGDAAVAACAEDGHDAVGQEMCRMYYVREGDDEVHALRVSDTAAISYLDDTGEEHAAAAVTDLRSTGSISDGPERVGLFGLQVQDGAVVALQEIFTP